MRTSGSFPSVAVMLQVERCSNGARNMLRPITMHQSKQCCGCSFDVFPLNDVLGLPEHHARLRVFRGKERDTKAARIYMVMVFRTTIWEV